MTDRKVPGLTSTSLASGSAHGSKGSASLAATSAWTLLSSCSRSVGPYPTNLLLDLIQSIGYDYAEIPIESTRQP